MSEHREDRPAADESRRDGWIDRLIDLFSLRGRESIRDDLGELLEEADGAPDLSAHERAMMRNILSLRGTRVSDVMIPRSAMVTVPAAISLAQLIVAFRTVGHSRLPVYGETLDEPLGMVHIRDLLEFLAAEAERRQPGSATLAGVDLGLTLASAEILRPVLFVPWSMPVIDLLARMQGSRTHMALVIDEYGGTDGLVSIEDLVETVVGDILDEHDEAAQMIVPDEHGDFLVDARTSLEDISELLNQDLTGAEDADGVGTIGGLVVARSGRVPRRGEVVSWPGGLSFEVLDSDARRLKRLRIRTGAFGPSESAVGVPAPDGAAPDGPARSGTGT